MRNENDLPSPTVCALLIIARTAAPVIAVGALLACAAMGAFL